MKIWQITRKSLGMIAPLCSAFLVLACGNESSVEELASKLSAIRTTDLESKDFYKLAFERQTPFKASLIGVANLVVPNDLVLTMEKKILSNIVVFSIVDKDKQSLIKTIEVPFLSSSASKAKLQNYYQALRKITKTSFSKQDFLNVELDNQLLDSQNAQLLLGITLPETLNDYSLNMLVRKSKQSLNVEYWINYDFNLTSEQSFVVEFQTFLEVSLIDLQVEGKRIADLPLRAFANFQAPKVELFAPDIFDVNVAQALGLIGFVPDERFDYTYRHGAITQDGTYEIEIFVKNGLLNDVVVKREIQVVGINQSLILDVQTRLAAIKQTTLSYGVFYGLVLNPTLDFSVLDLDFDFQTIHPLVSVVISKATKTNFVKFIVSHASENFSHEMQVEITSFGEPLRQELDVEQLRINRLTGPKWVESTYAIPPVREQIFSQRVALNFQIVDFEPRHGFDYFFHHNGISQDGVLQLYIYVKTSRGSVPSNIVAHQIDVRGINDSLLREITTTLVTNKQSGFSPLTFANMKITKETIPNWSWLEAKLGLQNKLYMPQNIFEISISKNAASMAISYQIDFAQKNLRTFSVVFDVNGKITNEELKGEQNRILNVSSPKIVADSTLNQVAPNGIFSVPIANKFNLMQLTLDEINFAYEYKWLSYESVNQTTLLAIWITTKDGLKADQPINMYFKNYDDQTYLTRGLQNINQTIFNKGKFFRSTENLIVNNMIFTQLQGSLGIKSALWIPENYAIKLVKNSSSYQLNCLILQNDVILKTIEITIMWFGNADESDLELEKSAVTLWFSQIPGWTINPSLPFVPVIDDKIIDKSSEFFTQFILPPFNFEKPEFVYFYRYNYDLNNPRRIVITITIKVAGLPLEVTISRDLLI